MEDMRGYNKWTPTPPSVERGLGRVLVLQDKVLIGEIARFWKMIEIKASSECWYWRGSLNTDGYGQCRFRGMRRANRVAYLLHYGSLDEKELVLHSCDTPACCNPYHLSTGDDAENARQRIDRGRQNQLKGEDHPHAKLTNHSVKEIRNLYEQGLTQMEIGKQFGVTQTSVSKIVRGEQWKD